VTSQITRGTSAELFLVLVLVYNLRVVERLTGTSKYTAMLLTSAALGTAIELALVALHHALTTPTPSLILPMGAHIPLFTALYVYTRIIPATYHVQFATHLTVSDRAFVYFIVGQMLLIRPLIVLPASVGVAIGWMWRANVLGMAAWRVPRLLRRAVWRLFGRHLNAAYDANRASLSSQERRRATTMEDVVGTRDTNNQTRGRRHVARAAAAQPVAAVDADTVQTYIDTLAGTTASASTAAARPALPPDEQRALLAAMFPHATREQIDTALSQANHDADRAAAALLVMPTDSPSAL